MIVHIQIGTFLVRKGDLMEKLNTTTTLKKYNPSIPIYCFFILNMLIDCS